MVDFDRAAHELALACAKNTPAHAPSKEIVWRKMAQVYCDSYVVIMNEMLRHTGENKND